MQSFLDYALKSAWLLLVLYWLWSAPRAKSHMHRQSLAVRIIAYWLPFLIAAGLLVSDNWFSLGFLYRRFLPDSLWIRGVGVALAIAGIALACWARHLLGRNWSMAVELKDEHELIQAGPYSIVRHPIYTGLLMGFIGTGLENGEWRALISIAIFSAFILYKLRVEERWLTELFGSTYSRYKDRTKALVPGLL